MLSLAEAALFFLYMLLFFKSGLQLKFFVGTPLPKHDRLVPPVEWRGQGGAGKQLRCDTGNWRCVVTPEQELVRQLRKLQLEFPESVERVEGRA